MPVTIPVGGGTFTAVEGETYILSANTTGNITFNGDVSFNVIVDTDQTAGANRITFGSGTDPTVTVSPGVDAANTEFDANGDTLTMDVGSGASVGEVDGVGLSDPAGMVLDAGDNVTFNGNIDAPTASGVTTTYTFGSGATVNGNLFTASRGDATVTTGDDLTVNGIISIKNGFASESTQTVTLGDGATINGSLSFSGAESVTFNAGDNLTIANSGTFRGSGGDDKIIFGDNWFVDGAVYGLAGDDQFYIGVQSPISDSTNFRGDAGADGITISPLPGDAANLAAIATSAGWIVNDDGTVESQPGSSALSYNGNLYNAMEAVATIPCFTTGTQIEVAHGATVSVEDLVQGDMVLTADRGLQPVRWIGTKTIAAAQLAAQENLRPIRIAAGALGGGLPAQDLLVSPQHRMLVRSKIARRMFGEDEVLVAAKHLVALEGIDVAQDVPEVTYVHFLCDTHEVVFANGAPSESLYTGPQALKSVSPEAVAEIIEIFPELAEIDYNALSARPLIKGRQGRQLAARHKKNDMELIAMHEGPAMSGSVK